MQGLFDDSHDLEFLRARLNVLVRRRRNGPLTAVEDAEYRELCARELTLLNMSAPPVDGPRSALRQETAVEVALQDAIRRAAFDN